LYFAYTETKKNTQSAALYRGAAGEIQHETSEASRETKGLKPEENMPQYPFQYLVGSLMFTSVNTRPYIAHTCSILSQLNSNYDKSHWKAAKHVLKYLRGTAYCCLTFERTG
jgi:hypothetical protein